MHTVLAVAWASRIGPRRAAIAGVLLALGSVVAAGAGCGGPEPRAAGPAGAPATKMSASEAAGHVDMNAIFPPGAGRDLVLNNCQNCHTFVPIVILQLDEDGWTRSSLNHRDRVVGLSDDEFKTLYDYVKANFNPGRPVPALPKALLDSWTTY
jgi:hypothetical protein